MVLLGRVNGGAGGSVVTNDKSITSTSCTRAGVTPAESPVELWKDQES